MMKKILFFILLVVVIFNFPIIENKAKAFEPTWCVGSEIGWNKTPNDCLVPCGDISVDGSYTTLSGTIRNLFDNYVGKCTGQATKWQITIRKIEIGTSAGWDGPRCTVLNSSNSVTVDLVSKNKGEIFSVLKTDFTKCPEIVYDRLYLTLDRKFLIAGNTKFPDGGVRVARTIADSSCVSDGLSEKNDSDLSSLSYLDNLTPYNGTTSTWRYGRCYGRPSNTWNNAYKKVALNSFSTSNLHWFLSYST